MCCSMAVKVQRNQSKQRNYCAFIKVLKMGSLIFFEPRCNKWTENNSYNVKSGQ